MLDIYRRWLCSVSTDDYYGRGL